MPVTTAPSDEACAAIVDRINSGSGITYTLPTAATYTFQLSDDAPAPTALKVDVVHSLESDLQETLDGEDRTSHDLSIVVRKKLPAKYVTADVAALNLIVRQIWQRVNGYRTSRVAVYDCGVEPPDDSDKVALREHGSYRRQISLRVEVEASP